MLKKDQLFKEAIGEFVINFSELESGIADLCWLIKPEEFESKLHLLNMDLSKKRKTLTRLISKLTSSEIKEIWSKANSKIGDLNEYRRYIIHGIYFYHIPNDIIKSAIPPKHKSLTNELTASKIIQLAKKLIDLNTGENGLKGEFYIMVKKVCA